MDIFQQSCSQNIRLCCFCSCSFSREGKTWGTQMRFSWLFFYSKRIQVLSSSHKEVYISANVTFKENEPFFSHPYLQGEISSMEDKDKDFFSLGSHLHSYLKPLYPTNNTLTNQKHLANNILPNRTLIFSRLYHKHANLLPFLPS